MTRIVARTCGGPTSLGPVGRRWDAVIDIAAYHPDVARRAVEILADNVDSYVFVSTLSVYADHSTTDSEREDGEVLQLTSDTDEAALYGARKAACESVVLDAVGPRATIARAGLLVGPHDRTNRFVYWPRRMAEGGLVLAPGAPTDLTQFLDVRDLASWLVRAAVWETRGIYNVAGKPTTFGRLLNACRAPGIDVELAWIPSDRLLSAGVNPWMGVPLWIGAPGWGGTVDVTRATNAGLTYRSLSETIRGAMDHPGDDGEPGLSRDAERDLLARCRRRSGPGEDTIRAGKD